MTEQEKEWKLKYAEWKTSFKDWKENYGKFLRDTF